MVTVALTPNIGPNIATGVLCRPLQTMINPDVDYRAIRSPHARVLTNERTTARLYYTQTPEQADSWQVMADDTLRFNHRFELSSLPTGKWYLRVEVADDSDNKRVKDDITMIGKEKVPGNRY